MATKVKPIPDNYRTVTPYLVVDNAKSAMEFYRRAFGAKEVMKMDGPGGKIAHAELKIGDSMIMISDEMPGSGARAPHSLNGTTASVFLYLEDVDSTFKQAVSAGAKVEAQPADMFWGDRYGRLTDPFGHLWSLATHKEDVAPQEMERRMREAAAKAGQQTHSAG
jgi:PhnB protein